MIVASLLACYLTWHLRQAWAPLTFTDEDPPAAASPVAQLASSEPHSEAAVQGRCGYPHHARQPQPAGYVDVVAAA